MSATKKIFKVVIVLFTALIITFLVCLISCQISCHRIVDNSRIEYDNVLYHSCGVSEGSHETIKKYCDERYYSAGRIDEYDDAGNAIEVKFIAAEVNGIPVMSMGKNGFNPIRGYESGTLKKLYAPGTIVNVAHGYMVPHGKRITLFYCGEVIDLHLTMDVHSYENVLLKSYVPNQLYDEFIEKAPKEEKDIEINRANISYRLNAEEMTEYYYVDYVDYGEKIENVPPEPTRAGYKFGGWYTENECINQWSFDNIVPQLAEGEEFKELCLYAKWIKK